MNTLETHHVDDWAEFIERENIDLTCPHCNGEAEDCEECGGIGYIEPMWNTIWNTGFSATSRDLSLPYEPDGLAVFAFDWDGDIWFGLAGCGMNLTPHLAATWVETFPQCCWLPEQFHVRGINLTHGYVVSCVGAKRARKIYKLMARSAELYKNDANSLVAELKEARKHLREQNSTSAPA